MRYSVVHVLLLTTVLCVVFALTFQVRDDIATELSYALAVCAFAGFLVGVVQGKGNLQSFSLGAAVPLAILLAKGEVVDFAENGFFPIVLDASMHRVIAGTIIAIILVGYIAVLVRWFIIHQDDGQT